MGLVYNRKTNKSEITKPRTSSFTPRFKVLTSRNRKFLRSLGFSVIQDGRD